MDYLPTTVPPDRIHRQNGWVKEFEFPESFLDGRTVSVEFWLNNFPLGDREEIVPVGRVVSMQIAVEKVHDLSPKFSYYIILDENNYFLKGNVTVTDSSGTNDISRTGINIVDGTPVIVEFSGGAYAQQLFAQMVEAKDATVAAQLDVAEKYPEIIEARDQVVAMQVRAIEGWEVATRAQAVTFSATLTKTAFIQVLADETQGGARILYIWDTVSLQEPLLL